MSVETGEVVELAVQRSVLDENQRGAGLMRLAAMPAGEFAIQLAMMKTGLERLREIQRNLMTKGDDYGVIPGTQKPTLLKPGAEKMCSFFRLVPTFSVDRIVGDGVTVPHLSYIVTSTLHLGDETGPAVGQGIGSCNSWERKYRYRRDDRACPECGKTGSLRLTKKGTPKEGWWCIPDKGGCGANLAKNDTRLSTNLGEVDNPDPYDLDNTLLKMAKKRSFIDGTLTATASSDLFTQDVEDMGGEAAAEPSPVARSAEPPSSTRPEPKAQPRAATEAQATPQAVPESKDPAIISAWQKFHSAIQAAGYGPAGPSPGDQESYSNWVRHRILEPAMQADMPPGSVAGMLVADIEYVTNWARTFVSQTPKPAGPKPIKQGGTS